MGVEGKWSAYNRLFMFADGNIHSMKFDVNWNLPSLHGSYLPGGSGPVRLLDFEPWTICIAQAKSEEALCLCLHLRECQLGSTLMCSNWGMKAKVRHGSSQPRNQLQGLYNLRNCPVNPSNKPFMVWNSRQWLHKSLEGLFGAWPSFNNSVWVYSMSCMWPTADGRAYRNFGIWSPLDCGNTFIRW